MNVPSSTIVVVGSGRSGTTVVLRAIDAAVPDTAAIPRLAGRCPILTIPASLMRRYRLPPRGLRSPSPESTALLAEAGVTQGRQIELGGRPMTLDDLPVDRRDAFPRRVEQVRRWIGCHTVALKNTATCARIPLMNQWFPEAAFIEVIRHPVAVVSSLLKSNFWPDFTLWWDGRTALQYCNEEQVSQPELAAMHWNVQVTTLRKSLQQLDPRRVALIRYEEFVDMPDRVLQQVGFENIDRAALDALEIRQLRPLSDYDSSLWDAVRRHCTDGMQQLGYPC